MLQDTAPVGVGIHHAALTSEERALLEQGFREGSLWALCCTTTLAAGVNLPARRVVFHSPRIGCAPLDSTRYRQAAGRAGRTGLDTVGEAFIVGRPAERDWLRSLITSVLPPVGSNFAVERRGMMRVLLEGVCSGSVKTVEQVRDYIMQTLLATMVAYESVHTAAKGALEYLEANRFVDWDREKEVFVPTQLGQATVESALSPDEALILLHELSNAQTRFVFTEDLHLVYHCTPLFSGVDPDWTFFEKLFLRLPPNLLGVAEAIGIDESFLALAARAPPKKDATSPQLITHRRFYVSLILFDVVREVPLQGLTKKYGLPRADIQRLMEQASSFAGMVSTFCDKLNWWFFPPLIDKMASRLQRGVEQDLLPLMKISGLSAWRARELYRKGYRTVASIALASESELEQVLLARGQQFRVSVAPSAPAEFSSLRL